MFQFFPDPLHLPTQPSSWAFFLSLKTKHPSNKQTNKQANNELYEAVRLGIACQGKLPGPLQSLVCLLAPSGRKRERWAWPAKRSSR